MKGTLFWFLAMTSTSFASSIPPMLPKEKPITRPIMDEIMAVVKADLNEPSLILHLDDIKLLLQAQANTLSEAVINKVLTTWSCADEYHLDHNHILTIIDYSKPSNQKRLWIFDLKAKKLLFYTYVSHGIKSGLLSSNYFSNQYDSKASSIGVYKTNQSYYGRDGLSLRLDGLERNFNDNAENRAVVMHGGWYVDEPFIKKYGRAGRSWGCPAVPLNLVGLIINTIKNNSLLVVYYPSDSWFVSSKFLNCPSLSLSKLGAQITTQPIVKTDEAREDILYVDLNQNNQREENEPILVISTEHYIRLLNPKVPLTRMLRRQINGAEYVALSRDELQMMLAHHQEALHVIDFVVPTINMRRGYYVTEMQKVMAGRLKEIKLKTNESMASEPSSHDMVYFDGRSSLKLRTTNRFIRWLGL